MSTTDIGTIVIVILVLLAQALWIFQDAQKRGHKYWLWGLFGLINVPSSLIIYLLVTRVNKTTCPQCHKEISKDYVICPYCRYELVAKG